MHSKCLKASTHIDAETRQDPLHHPANAWDTADGKLAHKVSDCAAVKGELELAIRLVLVRADLRVESAGVSGHAIVSFTLASIVLGAMPALIVKPVF